MLKSFNHTGFVVRDIDESISFYTEVMGLRVKSRGEASGESIDRIVGIKDAQIKTALVDLNNGHVLELVQYIYPPGSDAHARMNDLGASHLAFTIEDTERLYETLTQKGMRSINPPEHRYLDGRVIRKVFFGKDPDGNWLEFIEVLE